MAIYYAWSRAHQEWTLVTWAMSGGVVVNTLSRWLSYW